MKWYAAVSLGAVVAVAAACADSPTQTELKAPTAPRFGLGVAGAGYTTGIDDGTGKAVGCLDNKTGVDCNNYATKEDVYMSGGPPTGVGTLAAGTYFFAVLTPGEQNGGFLDAARGNLSDETVGGTDGDNGSGDLVSNRTFTVGAGGEITSYSGDHAVGTNPAGRTVIQLMPYDDTDNNGGVYILAICAVNATDPSQCKYDAFRIRNGNEPPPPPNGKGELAGRKYYDANRDGVWTPGEEFISNWAINVGSTTVYTDVNGDFTSGPIDPGSYLVNELLPLASTGWKQTGNVEDKSLSNLNSVTFHLTATLDWPAMSYTVGVVDGGTTIGLDFGNVCGPTPGGHTLGFWSNKNGLSLVTQTDINNLNAFYLRNGAGVDQNWTGSLNSQKSQLSSFLLSASATNMANMLSAQMTATYLSSLHGFTVGSTLIDNEAIPSSLLQSNGGLIPDASIAGLGAPRTVSQEITYANLLLRYYGYTVASSVARTEETRVKNIFDSVNNSLSVFQDNLTDALALCGTPFPTF